MQSISTALALKRLTGKIVCAPVPKITRSQTAPQVPLSPETKTKLVIFTILNSW